MIIVLTPGKVGSTAVSESLRLNGSLGEIYHLHSFFKELPADCVHDLDKLGHQVAKLYHSQNEINWKFILGVRDPVATLISAYYENKYISTGPLLEHDEFIPRHMSWMQNFIEFFYEKELGINLYQQSFDKEKGYSIVDQGKTSTLIYRLDKLSLIFQDAIEQFLKVPNVKLVKETSNSTIDKNLTYNGVSIKDSYEITIKNFKFPKQQLMEIYKHKSVQHFFNEEEIKLFIEKWS